MSRSAGSYGGREEVEEGEEKEPQLSCTSVARVLPEWSICSSGSPAPPRREVSPAAMC